MAHDETPERRDDAPEHGGPPGGTNGLGDHPPAPADPSAAERTPGRAAPSPWARPGSDGVSVADGVSAPPARDGGSPDARTHQAGPYSAGPSESRPTAQLTAPYPSSPGSPDHPGEGTSSERTSSERTSSERTSGEGTSGEGTSGEGTSGEGGSRYPTGQGYQLFSQPEGTQRPPTDPSRRRLILAGVVLALVVGLVGGGLGAVIGYQVAAHGGRLSVLDAPLPDADSAAPQASAVEQIAQRTLPSVVQLRVVAGREASAGSGMIVSPDGLIMTNNHVVAAAATGGTLNVLFQDGRITPATIVGRSKTFDVAVVKAQNVSGLPPITLGNSESVRVGQSVVAIGSPLGLGGTVTSGIVSALNRAVSVGSDEPDSPSPGLPPGLGGPNGGLPNPFQNGPNAGQSPQIPVSNSEVLNAIQTDASINPGNSGGPLVDIEGKVVGVNTAIASLASSGQGGSVGLGFAIPVNQVKRVAQELEQTGHAARAVIGVKIETRNQTGPLSGTTQAAIVEVSPGGPAAQANLKSGDVIAKIDQRPVTSADEVVAAVLSHAPGDRVTLTMGDGRTTQLGLGSQPSD